MPEALAAVRQKTQARVLFGRSFAALAAAHSYDPDNAPSDGPSMVPLKDFEALVKNLMAFDTLAKAKS